MGNADPSGSVIPPRRFLPDGGPDGYRGDLGFIEKELAGAFCGIAVRVGNLDSHHPHDRDQCDVCRGLGDLCADPAAALDAILRFTVSYSAQVPNSGIHRFALAASLLPAAMQHTCEQAELT